MEWLILASPGEKGSIKCKNLNPKLRHQGLRSVAQNSRLDFWDYVKKALEDKQDLLAIVLEKVNTNIMRKKGTT